MNANNNEIRTKSTTQINNPKIEFGSEKKLTNLTGTTYNNTPVREGIVGRFEPSFTWNPTDGYTVGASHSHPGEGVQSPADVMWMIDNASDPELNAAGSSAVQTYKDNVSITTITTDATYTINVADWAALEALRSTYTNARLTEMYITFAEDYLDKYPGASPAEITEGALLEIFGEAINLYKAPAGTTNFEHRELMWLGRSRTVVATPCP